jgi:hypothetical protein
MSEFVSQRMPRKRAMNAQKIFAAALILLSSLLVGCAYSIHPLYEEGKTVLEPGIAGTWLGENEDGSKVEMILAEAEHNSYKATFTEPASNRTVVYDVYLLRLGDQLYADILLTDNKIGKTDDDVGGLVPLHVFAKATVEKDTMTFLFLDGDWLKDQFTAHKLSIPHEDLDEYTTIFTAPPPKLQKLLRKISSNPDAFAKPWVLHRKK